MLNSYALDLLDIKKQETKVRQRRTELENKIAELVHGPESGQKTITLENGTKITVKRGFNYKVSDFDDLGGCAPCDIPAPVKMKTTKELDVVGYEWFRENRPDIFKEMAQFVTVTPKKVAVEVKVK